MSRGAPFGGFFAGKRVLVTGHTGFKGAWLAFWLDALGARVTGYALAPDGRGSLFADLGLARRIDSRLGDVRDAARLSRVVRAARSQIVFHLAAQALVRRSYARPAETFSTNVLGTAHVLDAVRAAKTARVVQVVTSDKCYENREDGSAYREGDRLGGRDPYSASKACAEIAAAAWRESFLASEGRVSLSTVRAGNVVGGGDWAEDRILPDCVRALSRGRPVAVRNSRSVRPWQHVLEPLSGYLWLCVRQWADPSGFAESWNFGPLEREARPVAEVVREALRAWGSGSWVLARADGASREAKTLRLDCAKARRRLSWRTVYGAREAVFEAIRWYRARRQAPGFDAAAFTRGQIDAYVAKAREAGLFWAAR